MAYAHSGANGGGYHASRPGLSARQPLFGGGAAAAAASAGADQVQLDMEGGAFGLDAEIEALSGVVGRMKTVSRAIGEESALTRQLLDGLEAGLEQGRLALRRTMRRLEKARRASGASHVTVVLLFALGCIFAVVFFRRVFAAIGWFLSWFT